MSTTSALHVRASRPRLTVRAVVNALAAWDARHRTRTHLSRLDDHLLRDAGITRADVAAELRRPLL